MKEENQHSSDGGFTRPLCNQQGQGTIEYILVLAVIVSIALGGMYQFHDAFGRYVDNYFGDYLSCLLETGELPNLGASSGTNCDENFEDFSLENGRPQREDTGGGAAGTTAGVGEDGAGATTQTARPGGDFARRQGATRAARDGRSSRRFRVAGSEDASGGVDFEDRSNRGVTAINSSGRRVRRIPANRFGSAVRDEEEREEIAKKKKSEKQGSERKKTALIPVKKTAQAAIIEDEETEFSLGKLFRYLIIAAIIIAMVIFIGGQALQLSKEWD